MDDTHEPVNMLGSLDFTSCPQEPVPGRPAHKQTLCHDLDVEGLSSRTHSSLGLVRLGRQPIGVSVGSNLGHVYTSHSFGYTTGTLHIAS
ncbi:hypothetical protein TNCV_4417591 [Trichonephila clavipes]|nr:hypothetical protein TNCV_4417591 [Trichonephila clavipes]